jgi:hypothetical protein
MGLSSRENPRARRSPERPITVIDALYNGDCEPPRTIGEAEGPRCPELPPKIVTPDTHILIDQRNQADLHAIIKDLQPDRRSLHPQNDGDSFRGVSMTEDEGSVPGSISSSGFELQPSSEKPQICRPPKSPNRSTI